MKQDPNIAAVKKHPAQNSFSYSVLSPPESHSGWLDADTPTKILFSYFFLASIIHNRTIVNKF